MENAENIIRRLTERPYISQQEAAKYLGISPGRVSILIKEGKIEAYRGGKTPKPYIESVLSYKTKPQMKRNRTNNENILES